MIAKDGVYEKPGPDEKRENEEERAPAMPDERTRAKAREKKRERTEAEGHARLRSVIVEKPPRLSLDELPAGLEGVEAPREREIPIERAEEDREKKENRERQEDVEGDRSPHVPPARRAYAK
jgi:hypothetical protein